MSFTPARRDVHWVDILIVVVLGLVAGVALTLLAAIAAYLVALALGVVLPALPQLVAGLQLDFLANHLALVLSDLGFLVVAWIVLRRRGGLAAYFPPSGAGLLALAVLSGVLLSVAINGGNEILSRAALVSFDQTDVERAIQPHTPAQYAVAFAVIALFAPFVEELFFRGMLFDRLRRSGRIALAIGVSALAFGAVHGQMFLHPGVQGWLYTAELIAAGVVLALWADRAGSLRASFATHAAYNATAIAFSALFP